MATLPQFVPVDTLQDLEYPQREAAFFYGLFLRGHSADQLRRDIEVPSAVLAKWHREAERDPQLKDVFERMVDYRRHVLAIFDALVGSDERVEDGEHVAPVIHHALKNVLQLRIALGFAVPFGEDGARHLDIAPQLVG